MPKVAIRLTKEGSMAFTLYHELYCEPSGLCECTISESVRPVSKSNGSSGLQRSKIKSARGIHLSWGDPPVTLDSAVRRLPQISRAEKTGQIEVKVIEEKLDATPSVASPKRLRTT